MRYLVVLYVALLLAFSGNANAQNQALMDSAVVDYQKGNYNEAIAIYDSILDMGYEAFEVYYNLGNAYYKKGEYTMAILNYERARLINPADEDLLHNLDMVNMFVVDKIETVPEFVVKSWMSSFINSLSSDMWGLFSVVLFITFLLLMIVFLFSRRIVLKKAGFWLGLIAMLLSVVTFIFSYKQLGYVENNNTAIVFSPSVTVKGSPDERGTDLFLIHEGLKVSVQDKVGDWVEIKLSDGNVGWMPEKGIEYI